MNEGPTGSLTHPYRTAGRTRLDAARAARRRRAVLPSRRLHALVEGGLDIYTTIDLDLQAEAEAAVERVLPQTAADGSFNPDAAAVVMGVTPADDGHILAMVGGRDFFRGSVVLSILCSKLFILKLDLTESSHILREVWTSLQSNEELCLLAISS